jgi:hypothetical protein
MFLAIAIAIVYGVSRFSFNAPGKGAGNLYLIEWPSGAFVRPGRRKIIAHICLNGFGAGELNAAEAVRQQYNGYEADFALAHPLPPEPEFKPMLRVSG